MGKEIFIGENKLLTSNSNITGSFEEINGGSFYKIASYHQMDPFFMTIVSNSDHWLFISSNGGVTAGRKNPDIALFALLYC